LEISVEAVAWQIAKGTFGALKRSAARFEMAGGIINRVNFAAPNINYTGCLNLEI
jgi:hypothetical protein